MTGRHKGVISFMRPKVPQVHLAGYVSSAAKKAIKAFWGAFDFNDILRQMAWYMNKSSNRQHKLKQLQEECSTLQLKLVEHCSTWWLSAAALAMAPSEDVLWGGVPTQEVQQQRYGDHQNRHQQDAHQDLHVEANNKAVCLVPLFCHGGKFLFSCS